MHNSSNRTSGVLLSCALVLFGCSSSDDPVATESSAATTEATSASSSTTPPPTSLPSTVAPATTSAPPVTEAAPPATRAPAGACGLVAAETIELLGESPVAGLEEAEVAGVSNCLYALESGGQVQVISIPAALWAQQIPAALEQVEQSGLADDAATADKFDAALQLIADGRADTPDGACELFSLMVELQGVGPGQTEVVNFVPSSSAPLAVNGQRCSAGQFSSVQLVADGLVDDVATYGRVVEALDAVHAIETAS